MPTVTLKLFSLQHNGAFPEAFTRKLRPTVLPLTLAELCGFFQRAAAEYPSDLGDPAAFPAGILRTKPDSLSGLKGCL